MDRAPWMTAEGIWLALDQLALEVDIGDWQEFYLSRINAVVD